MCEFRIVFGLGFLVGGVFAILLRKVLERV